MKNLLIIAILAFSFSSKSFSFTHDKIIKDLNKAAEQLNKNKTNTNEPKPHSSKSNTNSDSKKQIAPSKNVDLNPDKATSKKQDIKSSQISNKQYKFCNIKDSYSFADKTGLLDLKYKKSSDDPGNYIFTNYVINNSELRVIKYYLNDNSQIVEDSETKNLKLQYDNKNNLYYVTTDPSDEYRTYYDFSDDEVIKYESRYLRRMGSGNTWEIKKSYTSNCFKENDQIVKKLYEFLELTSDIKNYLTKNSVKIDLQYCALSQMKDYSHYNIKSEGDTILVEMFKESETIPKKNEEIKLILANVFNDNLVFYREDVGAFYVVDNKTKQITVFLRGVGTNLKQFQQTKCLSDEEIAERKKIESERQEAYVKKIREENELRYKAELEEKQRIDARNKEIEKANAYAQSPEGQLVASYMMWICIDEMYKARQDYKIKYVTPSQLNNSKKNIRYIENYYVKKNKVNKDKAWKVGSERYFERYGAQINNIKATGRWSDHSNTWIRRIMSDLNSIHFALMEEEGGGASQIKKNF